MLARSLRGWPGSAATISAPSTAGLNLDYDRAFTTAERTLAFFLTDGQPVVGPPGELLAELGLPGSAEATPASRAHRLAIPFLTRWLIEKSHSRRYSDPEEMLHWALMARLSADGCSPEAAGSEPKRANLRAGAEAQLSSALRVLGRLEESEECMKTAWAELERGTGDPELRATVFAQTTSLLTLQGDFQLAVDLSNEASTTYGQLGMTHRSASAKVTGALAMVYDGDPEQAAGAFQRVLPEIDPDDDPTLLLVARTNLVRCFIDLREPAKALAAYKGLQRIRLNVEPLLLLRMDWQKGLLLKALSDPRAAAHILGQVRRGYVERRLAREAIVVTRDLIKTLAELGENERASNLLEETAGWIRGMNFGSETSRFFDELRAASL